MEKKIKKGKNNYKLLIIGIIGIIFCMIGIAGVMDSVKKNKEASYELGYKEGVMYERERLLNRVLAHGQESMCRSLSIKGADESIIKRCKELGYSVEKEINLCINNE